MSTKLPPGVSESTAQLLTSKLAKVWTLEGEKQTAELKKLYKSILIKLNNSDSPSKTITYCIKQLENFLQNKYIKGNLVKINARHLMFLLSYVKMAQDGIVYTIVDCEINARTKNNQINISELYKITIHTIQRLLERSSSRDDIAALDEIHSAEELMASWILAAKNVNAVYWPVLSKSGFFVCTNDDNKKIMAITWISDKSLSKKWQPAINLLRNIQHSDKNELLKNEVFVGEFIRSFPWMLNEHFSKKDSISLAWEQKDLDENSCIKKNKENEEIDRLIEFDQPKASISYKSGFNYQNNPPNFKANTKLRGIVTNIIPNLGILIGLQNGWVGLAPQEISDEAKRTIPNYKDPVIGDYVDIYVYKIRFIDNENAYLISVNIDVIHKAIWEKVELNYPVGMTVKAKIFSTLSNEYCLQLSDGTRGLINKNKVDYFMAFRASDEEKISESFDVSVIGYIPEKRNLEFDLIDVNFSESQPYQVGDIVTGIVVKKTDMFCVLSLENSTNGVLHKYNHSSQLPEVGNKVTCKVIFLNNENNSVSLAEVISSTYFYALPLTDETWEQFISSNTLGDIIEVQAKAWLGKNKTLLVATKSGITGVIRNKELSWASGYDEGTKIEINSIFKAKIININHLKHKVELSVRQISPHPVTKLDLEDLKKIKFKGVITNIRDYGLFVYVTELGCIGLLHKTKLPVNPSNFQANQEIDIYVESVDINEFKLSLSLYG